MRLAELLDEDQWAECERRLFDVADEANVALGDKADAARKDAEMAEVVGRRPAAWMCAPNNGGSPFVIDRAPDSWELRNCRITPLYPAPAPATPEGWKFERKNDVLGTIIISAPNGYTACVNIAARNSANILYMLADLFAAPVAPKEKL